MHPFTLLLTVLALAQPAPVSVPPAELTALVLAPADAENAWLELTLLEHDAAPVLVSLGTLSTESPVEPLRPPLPPGPTLACSGGSPWAISCEILHRGEHRLGAPDTLELTLRSGLPVMGVYVLDLFPVGGARVAVVPADLSARQPFTLPLAVDGSEVRREVLTDDDGRFTLPPLAPGSYFLEALLPWGRLHRSDPFTLPEPAEAQAGAAEGTPIVWDLGLLDVADGLAVTVRVQDPQSDPIAGAAITSRQGTTALEVETFQTRTNADGVAVLSGFTATAPVTSTCAALGFRARTFEHVLVPTEITCALEPWAAVAGEVLALSGEPVAATVSAVPLPLPLGTPEPDPALDGLQSPASPVAFQADVEGTFLLPELAGGSWTLIVAAPGHGTAELEIELDAGERLLLEPIVLGAGAELSGQVLDLDTGAPLAGVEIFSIDPPGAAEAFSGTDGRFTVTVDPDRRLILGFRTPDYAPREVAFEPSTLEADDEVLVTLAPAGWILARVFEADGQPCAGCRLELRPSGRELITDGYGEALSPPLAAGWYRVLLPHMEHLGSTVVEEPESRWRWVKVERGEVAEVRFERAEQTLEVEIRPAPDGLWTLSARSTSGRTERRMPEANGHYLLERPKGEELVLTLHHWDTAAEAELSVRLQTVPADPAPSARRLVGAEIPVEGDLETPPRPFLSRGAPLGDSLRLRLPDTLVAGRVHLRGPNDSASGARRPGTGLPIKALRLVDRVPFASTATAADGSFRIPHLPPGIYIIQLGERPLHFVALGPGQRVDLRTFEVAQGTF